jgi:hypothetical protein
MIIQKLENVAAGATNDNILAGSAFEFPRTNVVASMGIVAADVDVFATVQAGGEIVLEESEIAVSTDFPLIPDEFYYNFAALAGDRLVIRIRNANAGAQDVRAIVMLTQV